MSSPPSSHECAAPGIIVTVDAVVLTMEAGELKAVMTRRPEPPFAGVAALPGGYVRHEEDADTSAAIRRVLRAKTGLSGFHLEQLQTFSGADRDPRGWSISVAHLSIISRADLGPLKPGVELMAVDAATGRLPCPVGFDHDRIVGAALQRLKGKGAWSNLPAFLLPEEFTLAQLQEAYEVALGERMDKAVFRRKIQHLDLVEATGRKEVGVSWRPAEIYRIKGPDRFLARTFDRMI